MFRKLDVYRCSIDLLALSARLVASLPRGQSDLADQFRRASPSIPLNIAEAAGRTGVDDQRRHHAIARGSAMECAAILDAGVAMGMLGAPEASEGDEMLERIVQMLTKMCR